MIYHQNKLINKSSSNSKVITKDCAERNYLFQLLIAEIVLAIHIVLIIAIPQGNMLVSDVKRLRI